MEMRYTRYYDLLSAHGQKCGKDVVEREARQSVPQRLHLRNADAET